MLSIGTLTAALRTIVYGSATTGLFTVFQTIGRAAVLPAAGAVMASASAVGAGIASVFSDEKEEETVEDNEGAPPPLNSSQIPGPPERIVPGEK